MTQPSKLVAIAVPTVLAVACFAVVGFLRSAERGPDVAPGPGSGADAPPADDDVNEVVRRVAATYATGRVGLALEEIHAVPDWQKREVLRKSFRDILLQWIRFDLIGCPRRAPNYEGLYDPHEKQYRFVVKYLQYNADRSDVAGAMLVRLKALPYAEELAASQDAADVEAAFFVVEFLLLERLHVNDWEASAKLVDAHARIGVTAGCEERAVDRLFELKRILYALCGYGTAIDTPLWAGQGWLVEGIYRQYPSKAKAQDNYRTELRRRMRSDLARGPLSAPTSEDFIALAKTSTKVDVKRKDAWTALGISLSPQSQQSAPAVEVTLALVKECVPQDADVSEAIVRFKCKPGATTRAALDVAIKANLDWPGADYARYTIRRYRERAPDRE